MIPEAVVASTNLVLDALLAIPYCPRAVGVDFWYFALSAMRLLSRPYPRDRLFRGTGLVRWRQSSVTSLANANGLRPMTDLVCSPALVVGRCRRRRFLRSMKRRFGFDSRCKGVDLVGSVIAC